MSIDVLVLWKLPFLYNYSWPYLNINKLIETTKLKDPYRMFGKVPKPPGALHIQTPKMKWQYAFNLLFKLQAA